LADLFFHFIPFPFLFVARPFLLNRIKGKEFSISGLLGSPDLALTLGSQPSLAIFRLAPQDYHRYHSPITGIIGPITKIPGALYTVNPQAINTSLSVYTSNQRWIVPITAVNGKTIYVVAVGAMLVGSNTFSVTEGDTVNKGDELGWFSYGGSTVIAVLPEGIAQWDEDLKAKSCQTMETLVRVGEQVGRLKL
jgi:phosphatidylserine decarboxylase